MTGVRRLLRILLNLATVGLLLLCVAVAALWVWCAAEPEPGARALQLPGGLSYLNVS